MVAGFAVVTTLVVVVVPSVVVVVVVVVAAVVVIVVVAGVVEVLVAVGAVVVSGLVLFVVVAFASFGTHLFCSVSNLQQAAYQGFLPSLPLQYLGEGLPSLQTAPGHPRGCLLPFTD